MKTMRGILPVLFVVIVSFVAILPFFSPGFFTFHDNTQVARVFEMHKSLSDGLLPVRWVADLGYGYGYPIFSFYAPLAYYVGAFFMFVGLSALSATKVMIALGILISGITMYVFSREFLSKWGSSIASILYVFAPYHALDVFVRGAIGEVYAYAFIPLAFYGFFRLSRRHDRWSYLIVCGGLGGVIISHNLTALLIFPFIMVEVLLLIYCSTEKKRVIIDMVSALLLSLVVTAWYWLPALGEMGYTNVASQTGGGSQYKDHFVCLSQLWSSPWGFGGSVRGCLDGLSFQLGKLHILFAVLGLLSLPLLSLRKRVMTIVTLIGLGISLFFLLEISKPIWDSLSFMKFLQFPWRFLQLALFLLAIIGGIGWDEVALRVNKISKRKFGGVIISLGVILVTVVFYTKLFKPQQIINPYPDETTRSALTWTISKISDEYLPKDFSKPLSPQQVPTLPYQPTLNALVRVDSQTTSHLVLTAGAASPTVLQLNKAYFPAWNITLDGHSAHVNVKNGRYFVALPGGSHQLVAQFSQTPLEKLANIISLLGSGLIIILAIIQGKVKQDG